MAERLSIEVSKRTQQGRAAMRQLRHQKDWAPGVVYGAGKDQVWVASDHDPLYRFLAKEATHSQVIDLVIDGKSEPVVVKEVQYHPVAAKIIHVDWLRINAKEKLTLKVPLHFVGEDVCPGIKAGGVAQHAIKELEVQCLPANLPEYLEVDLSQLEMDQSIHCSELKLPKGVELSCLIAETPHDEVIVAVHQPKVVAEEPAGSAEGSDESAAEDAPSDASGEGNEQAG